MKGEELREIRLQRKYTQKQLGEQLGYKGKMAERIIQSWEYNERRIPVTRFRELSRILDIPLEKFIP